MSQLQTLNKKQHQNIRIDQTKSQLIAADSNMMPVMLSEFSQLSIDYPILLTKNGDTGAFVSVALTGLEPSENLFWQGGRWQATYIPLAVRRLPFAIGHNENKASENDHDFLICIDPDSPAISQDAGELIFDATGNPSPYLQTIQGILGRLIEGEAPTRTFVETLLDQKLVTPLTLDIELVNAEKLRVEGMYGIDEERINSLNKDALYALHEKGYLAALYSMINSMGHIHALVEKKNSQLGAADPWLTPGK